MSSWVEVGDRVFVRRYSFYDQNIGAILGHGEVLVVDTRSTHVQGREILDDLRLISHDPVTVVVDTHGHFDHCFGNHVFRPAAIWGQAGCRPFIERTAEVRRERIAREVEALASDLDDVVFDPPDRSFETAATVEVGGRAVDLRFLGRAHTDHDAIIVIPDAEVVFAGDTIEGGNVPFFNDGYPLEWPATVAALAELVTGAVVPGHGDVAGRGFVEDQAAAIKALVQLGRRVQAGELSLDDALALTPFPEFPVEDIRAPMNRTLLQLRGDLD
jgi:glyoxylase-like metal-dependent hydrolase (beta-lactamase superfamily II)